MDEIDFIRPYRLGSKITETVIPNGINLNRITQGAKKYRKPRTFMAFAGRNVQKRTDILVSASRILKEKGINIDVILVGNEQTTTELSDICGDIPQNVKIIKQQEDVNRLFAMADCFVSTSVHETFSYAIAEASIYGLPVIQSDISGTDWNSKNPSTLVFRSEDANDLANKIELLINTPVEEIRKNCKQTAIVNVSNYSLKAWTEKVIDFFERI